MRDTYIIRLDICVCAFTCSPRFFKRILEHFIELHLFSISYFLSPAPSLYLSFISLRLIPVAIFFLLCVGDVMVWLTQIVFYVRTIHLYIWRERKKEIR